jgi:hypothetical protein
MVLVAMGQSYAYSFMGHVVTQNGLSSCSAFLGLLRLLTRTKSEREPGKFLIHTHTNG